MKKIIEGVKRNKKRILKGAFVVGATLAAAVIAAALNSKNDEEDYFEESTHIDVEPEEVFDVEVESKGEIEQ